MSETGHCEGHEVTGLPRIQATDPRKSRRFATVAWVFLGLLAIGLTAAWVVYRTYVAYEPKAARHVPSDAPIVLRFDLTHVMFYEPFRRSIFPLVDRFAPEGASRRDRLAKRGLRIGADVREVVLASGPGPKDWVVVLAGPMPQKGLGNTIASVLRGEGLSVVERDEAFVLSDSRIAFAQAEDGAFVLASEQERLKAALPVRASRAELAIGAGGFSIERGALGAELGALQGSFRTGSVVMVELRAASTGGASVTTESAVRALLERFGRLDALFERPAEQAALELDGTQVRARVLLPREAVERIAARVAAGVPGSKGLESPR